MLSVPQLPEKYKGRVAVCITYTGWSSFREFLPRKWQAWLIGRGVACDYRSSRWPLRGVAVRLPDGTWFGLRGPDGKVEK